MKIAIIADFDPSNETHVMTNRAIEHSNSYLDSNVGFEWILTENIDFNLLPGFSGFLIGPGSPYKSMSKVLKTIQYARENNVPILGTCGGFQHMVIEFARNVLNIKDAESEETDPASSHLFISRLACSLRGRKMDISLKKDSKIASIYGTTSVQENYYCNFGVNPDYIDRLKSVNLKVVGSDAEGEVRIIEIVEHPFYIGTLFVPQTNSRPESPHPIVTGFLDAAVKFQLKKLRDTETAGIFENLKS